MVQDVSPYRLEPNELVVAIGGSKPLPAIMFGNLINALSRDYKSMYRDRTLVISRIQTGSLLIFVQDAYEAAKPYIEDGVGVSKGVKAIMDFAKMLRDSFGTKKASADLSDKTGPYRSIQEIVRIAAETGASVSLRHRSNNGDEIEVDVNQAQAVAIRASVEAHPEQAFRAAIKRDVALASKAASTTVSLPDLADTLAQLPEWALSTPNPMITIVVRVLQEAGVGYLAENLAMELDARGLFDVAGAVRLEAGIDLKRTTNTHL